GHFNYRMPLRDPRNRVLFDVSRNTYDITSGVTSTTGGLNGLATNGMLGYERALTRGRNLNWYFQTDFSRKRGETLFGTSPVNQDDLAVLGAMLRYDRIIARANVI